MASFSLDQILHRARGLCAETGVDPDQPGPDGKPEWFRFIGAARDSLRRDQHAQDPLAFLKKIEMGERAREAIIDRAAVAPESSDPLEKLQALYQQAMESADARARDANQSSTNDLAPALEEAGPAQPISPPHSDPLEALKALEVMGTDAMTRDDPGDPSAPEDPQVGGR
jgi:hypothetical protein